MSKIYFNSNEFTPLSNEVKTAMKKAVEDFADANLDGFGNDYRVEAEAEEIKSSINERLKAESCHLYFTNGLPQSEIELINLSVLQLDVELIITSLFERKEKLNYLKNLAEAGRINLHLLRTSDFGEIDLEDLKHILEANKSKALISLSHTNSFTGVLLPVKDISGLAKQNNAYFHLDSSLMIGKYELDLSRMDVDFLSLDVNLINGPVGIGCLFVNENIATSNNQFNLMRSTLKSTENRNIVLISAVGVALSNACENIREKQIKTSELRNYFIAELENKLQLKTVGNFLKKKGLFNQLAFFASKEKLGNYFIENLDLNGFIVSKNGYPIDLSDFRDNYFINISFSIGSIEEEIDSFVSFMKCIEK